MCCGCERCPRTQCQNCRSFKQKHTEIVHLIALERVMIALSTATPPPPPSPSSTKHCPKIKDHAKQCGTLARRHTLLRRFIWNSWIYGISWNFHQLLEAQKWRHSMKFSCLASVINAMLHLPLFSYTCVHFLPSNHHNFRLGYPQSACTSHNHIAFAQRVMTREHFYYNSSKRMGRTVPDAHLKCSHR